MRALWLALLSLVVQSCGQGAPRVREPTGSAVSSAQPGIDAAALAGHWKWSHVSVADGVRRIEAENWYIEAAPQGSDAPGSDPADSDPAAALPRIAGHYVRTIDFLAEDGVPFACSQDLGYQLRATYQIRGSIRGSSVEIEELSVHTEPSPCESGERTLGRYRGQLEADGAQLRLGWGSGTQTLTRLAAPAGAPLRAMMPSMPERPSQTAAPLGAWRWHSRTQNNDQVRVEREDWQLADDGNGTLRGTVERTVTIFDERGVVYPCSGESFYQYVDRYTVRAEPSGARWQIREVDVHPQDHPCLDYQKRHLDSATAVLAGGYLELEWRGARRQVLHRPR